MQVQKTKNILITGMPKSGKSTLLRKIIKKYNHKVGFVTNEIREDGERIGFELETHSGKTGMLANTKFITDFRVSKYSVDIKKLNTIIPDVRNSYENDLLFLDEIGQM